MYGYSYSNNQILPRINSFSPLQLPALKFWGGASDTTYVNSLLAANFVASNSEYLSSSSSDFAFGDESFSIVCWVKFNNSAVRNDILGKARLQTTQIAIRKRM